jgi:hypothetical protein
MTVKFVFVNMLENGTVTVTSEDTGYPAFRLYDRDINLMFKGGSAPTNFYITVDQGTSGIDVNRLIIPAGHNLGGKAIKLQRSTDNFGSSVIDVDSWTQADSSMIVRGFTQPATTRYWRLNITTGGAVPQLSEIFLGLDYEVESPTFGGKVGVKHNVERVETDAGVAYFVEKGSRRATYRYRWAAIGNSDKSKIQALVENGIKPFFLYDTAGSWVVVELVEDHIEFEPISYGNWAVEIEMREVL